MNSEIYIENRRLDITGDFSSLLTMAIDDIKDFSSRNTTFSKTIILPGTANNNLLFGHIFDAKISNPFDPSSDNVSTNFNASVGAACIMFQGNIQVFKGTLRLMEIVISDGVPEYEVAVFGELGGLVSALGIGKLEDLDFSAYDHVLNVSGITSSWDNPGGSGYYYPLIDYGNVSINKIDYDLLAFRPALYVKEYIDKIFEYAGYNFTCDLFETDRFKKLIIPNNQKRFQRLTNVLLSAFTTEGVYIINQPTPTAPNRIPFDLVSLGSFTANGDNSEFTYTGTDTYSTFLNIELNLTLAGGLYTFTFHLLKNGVSIYDFGDIYRPNGSTLNTTKQVSDLPVQISTGDVFTIEVSVHNTGGGLGSFFVFLNEGIWTVNTANEVYSDINLGDPVTINDTLPKNILQKDFLSSIVKLFNLYLYEDVNSPKKILIKPYVDFFDLNVSGVTDWDYKMDRSKPVRLKPMSELNSRYYNFKFKPDNDYYNELYAKRYNESYGDRIYDSEFEFTNERTDIELIFSPSVLVGYSGVDKIVSAFYKQNATGIEQEQGVNIRILQSKKITDVEPWDILDNTDVIEAGLTDYGYAGHYDDPDAPNNDIHFGVPKELYFTLVTGAVNVTQFNVYWSPYMAEITDKDSKLLTAFFKLSNKDIYELDFSKLIHVDGSYWRLNKIIDWNASEPDVCRSELIKLINMIY